MNAVVSVESRSTGIDRLIDRMSTGGTLDPATLRELLAVKKEYEADEARKAFVSAMAAFKADPPTIVKNKHVSFQTSKGLTEYDHATLAQVCTAVAAGLGRHGLSHRWETAQEGQRITVTCVLTHQDGHSERTALAANADDSGGKNSIQAIGSAVSYLQRYTLMSATGLAAKDMDDDGRGAEKRPTEPTIDERQLLDLRALLQETNANEAQLCRALKVERLEDIFAKNFDHVCREVRARKSR